MIFLHKLCKQTSPRDSRRTGEESSDDRIARRNPPHASDRNVTYCNVTASISVESSSIDEVDAAYLVSGIELQGDAMEDPSAPVSVPSKTRCLSEEKPTESWRKTSVPAAHDERRRTQRGTSTFEDKTRNMESLNGLPGTLCPQKQSVPTHCAVSQKYLSSPCEELSLSDVFDKYDRILTMYDTSSLQTGDCSFLTIQDGDEDSCVSDETNVPVLPQITSHLSATKASAQSHHFDNRSFLSIPEHSSARTKTIGIPTSSEGFPVMDSSDAECPTTRQILSLAEHSPKRARTEFSASEHLPRSTPTTGNVMVNRARTELSASEHLPRSTPTTRNIMQPSKIEFGRTERNKGLSVSEHAPSTHRAPASTMVLSSSEEHVPLPPRCCRGSPRRRVPKLQRHASTSHLYESKSRVRARPGLCPRQAFTPTIDTSDEFFEEETGW